jgi:predicted deacylase
LIHFNGYIAAMQTAGMLPGEPARPKQEVLHGERYQVTSTQSGVWHPAVIEGQVVEKGQLLGRLTDYFGNVLEEHFAPRRSQVFYYWSSPAINAERTPHGYQWHNALVSLLALE